MAKRSEAARIWYEGLGVMDRCVLTMAVVSPVHSRCAHGGPDSDSLERRPEPLACDLLVAAEDGSRRSPHGRTRGSMQR